MGESIRIILTVIAFIIIFLGIIILFLKFILAPLLSLLAMPTYAAMLGIECFIDYATDKRCPTFFRLKKAKAFGKKFFMDFFATYCCLSGLSILYPLFEGFPAPPKDILKSIEDTAHGYQFIAICLFWLFLLVVYLISFFYKDNPEHSINKLEELVIPDWVRKIIEKAIG